MRTGGIEGSHLCPSQAQPQDNVTTVDNMEEQEDMAQKRVRALQSPGSRAPAAHHKYPCPLL